MSIATIVTRINGVDREMNIADVISNYLWPNAPTTNLYPYTIYFNVAGTISVANNVALHVVLPATFTPTYLVGSCTTGPVGSDVHVKFRFSTNNGISFTQDTTTFTVALDGTGGDFGPQSVGAWGAAAAWTVGTHIGLDVTQVGSGTAGAGLSVALTGTIAFTGF